MAGELKLSQVAAPSNPASGKDSIFVSNDTPERVKRVDSGGTVYIFQEHLGIYLASDFTMANVATVQAAFNSPTNGAVTLPTLTAYEFDWQFWLTNTGTTSHTWAILFGGTATLTSGMMVAQAHTAVGNVLGADSSIMSSTLGTALVVTPASTSATENVMVRARGIVRINGGGTLIPQIQASAATGVAPTMKANSFFRMTPIGSNTVASLGNWS